MRGKIWWIRIRRSTYGYLCISKWGHWPGTRVPDVAPQVEMMIKLLTYTHTHIHIICHVERTVMTKEPNLKFSPSGAWPGLRCKTTWFGLGLS